MGAALDCGCQQQTRTLNFDEILIPPILLNDNKLINLGFTVIQKDTQGRSEIILSSPGPDQLFLREPKKYLTQISSTKVMTDCVSPKSAILSIHVSKMPTQIPQDSLIFDEITIPKKVTQSLKIVEDYVKDPYFVDMFKDCALLTIKKLEDDQGTYVGQWSHGIRTGFGRILYCDNTYYEGFWVNNERHFHGRYVNSDGEVYVGQWFADQMSGRGKFYHSDGTIYDINTDVTERSQKYLSAKPTIEYPDGRLYYGDTLKGFKHGFGVYRWPDHTEYFGYYKDNKQEGYGVMLFADGRSYQGQWGNGMKHGLGMFKWPNGQIFIGLFENDLKEGYGMFVWPNGQKYRGQFIGGEINGIGRMISRKGQVVEAKWENGKRLNKSELPSPIMSNIFSPQHSTVEQEINRDDRIRIGDKLGDSVLEEQKILVESKIFISSDENLEQVEKVEVVEEVLSKEQIKKNEKQKKIDDQKKKKEQDKIKQDDLDEKKKLDAASKSSAVPVAPTQAPQVGSIFAKLSKVFK